MLPLPGLSRATCKGRPVCRVNLEGLTYTPKLLSFDDSRFRFECQRAIIDSDWATPIVPQNTRKEEGLEATYCSHHIGLLDIGDNSGCLTYRRRHAPANAGADHIPTYLPPPIR